MTFRPFVLTAVVAAAAAAACSTPRPSMLAEPPLAGKRVEARRGMVVTSASDASAAGLAMLEQGGNAIDAAVAASFALAVVDPSQTGIGGYAVGVAWLAKERRAEVMEGMSQAGADPAWGQPDPRPDGTARPTSFDGGDARQPRNALVPGFVAGLLEWHAQRGRLPRATVLAPAIRLARDGFIVGPLNHRLFAASRDKLMADPEAAALYMPGGEPLRVGDRLVQAKLAGVLDAISRDGAAAFYAGEIPRRIAEKTRAVGGLLDAADFAAYRPAMRRPMCSAFLQYTVLGGPSPVAGSAIAEMLNLAEATGLARMPDPTRDSVSAVRLADAVRLSVLDRRGLGGHPEWARIPVRGMASRGFAASRASLVGTRVVDSIPRGDPWVHEAAPVEPRCAALDPHPAATRAAGGGADGGTGDTGYTGRETGRDTDSGASAGLHDAAAGAASGNTSHLVVVDSDGTTVSLTSSVGVLFGSGVFAEGVWLNSSGSLFSRGDRQPGRKPGSGISPMILMEGQRVRLAAGAGGAAYIVPAVGQVILRMAAWKQDPWAAISAPRLQPDAGSPALEIEQGFALPVYGALRAHGYMPSNRVANLQFAGVHAVWIREDGTMIGVADPRRDGVAMGR